LEAVLKVLVLKEGGTYVSQGLDVDCVGHGRNVEESEENFVKKLEEMISLNLKEIGEAHFVGLPAHEDHWKKFRLLSRVVHVEKTRMFPPVRSADFPFRKIRFFEKNC